MKKPDRLADIRSFAERIDQAPANKVVEGQLKTSERILKRITDGIYRQPSSALRELISNAYDADATLVEIQTDPPRFNTIRIRDNGHGLSAESLAHLIHSIGGSAKRTTTGIETGDCNRRDATRSPGGRKLIGKIGIGLFSVSQLTKEFQVITKTKGSQHRTVADVVMHTHSEDVGEDPDANFATGTVRIWKTPASDKDSHGTEVILRNLLFRTKEDLRSVGMWEQCATPQQAGLEEVSSVAKEPPAYHIGRVSSQDESTLASAPSLPWGDCDSPSEKFEKLVVAMDALRSMTRMPSIVECLDVYLQMMWTLALTSPLDYMAGHPFDITADSAIQMFLLGNHAKSQATPLHLRKTETPRAKLSLRSPERGGANGFRILLDGVQLARPLRFTSLPTSCAKTSSPLLFIGRDKPDLSSIPENIRGGDLEFEAYLFWNHTIVPKEHSGVLIRINDSNGVLFDETFMKYPVSEVTRKRQVTAEVFVMRGLDAALNIDRESFNYAHPHYLYLTRWVHNAFRQFATRQKSIAKEALEQSRAATATSGLTALEKRVADALQSIRSKDEGPPPVVEFVDTAQEQETRREEGVLAFTRSEVLPEVAIHHRKTKVLAQRQTMFEAQMKSVARVLEAFGVFESMPYRRQQRLLREIAAVFVDNTREVQ